MPIPFKEVWRSLTSRVNPCMKMSKPKHITEAVTIPYSVCREMSCLYVRRIKCRSAGACCMENAYKSSERQGVRTPSTKTKALQGKVIPSCWSDLRRRTWKCILDIKQVDIQIEYSDEGRRGLTTKRRLKVPGQAVSDKSQMLISKYIWAVMGSEVSMKLVMFTPLRKV